MGIVKAVKAVKSLFRKKPSEYRSACEVNLLDWMLIVTGGILFYCYFDSKLSQKWFQNGISPQLYLCFHYICRYYGIYLVFRFLYLGWKTDNYVEYDKENNSLKISKWLFRVIAPLKEISRIEVRVEKFNRQPSLSELYSQPASWNNIKAILSEEFRFRFRLCTVCIFYQNKKYSIQTVDYPFVSTTLKNLCDENGITFSETLVNPRRILVSDVIHFVVMACVAMYMWYVSSNIYPQPPY